MLRINQCIHFYCVERAIYMLPLLASAKPALVQSQRAPCITSVLAPERNYWPTPPQNWRNGSAALRRMNPTSTSGWDAPTWWTSQTIRCWVAKSERKKPGPRFRGPGWTDLFRSLLFYSEFKKFSRSVFCVLVKATYAFFAVTPSPPCHRIASSIVLARPSCR